MVRAITILFKGNTYGKTSLLLSDAAHVVSLSRRSHENVSRLFGEASRDESPNNNLSLSTLANRGWDVESCLNLGFGSTRVQWYGAKSE